MLLQLNHSISSNFIGHSEHPITSPKRSQHRQDYQHRNQGITAGHIINGELLDFGPNRPGGVSALSGVKIAQTRRRLFLDRYDQRPAL